MKIVVEQGRVTGSVKAELIPEHARDLEMLQSGLKLTHESSHGHLMLWLLGAVVYAWDVHGMGVRTLSAFTWAIRTSQIMCGLMRTLMTIWRTLWSGHNNSQNP